MSYGPLQAILFSAATAIAAMSLARPSFSQSFSANELRTAVEGKVEIHAADSAALTLGDETPLRFRDGLELNWLQHGQFLPAKIWDQETGFVMNPDEPNNWTRLSLRITLSASEQLIRNSYGMELSVYLSTASKQFYGEEQVNGSVSNIIDLERFSTNHFLLVLNEVPPMQELYEQAVEKDCSTLPPSENISVINDLILAYKVKSTVYYLNDIARCFGFYLKSQNELPISHVEFVQKLHKNPEFRSLPLEDQFEKMHAFALQFNNALTVNTLLSGTNSLTNRGVARTLLNRIPIPDNVSAGEPYKDSIQKAITLKMQIICSDDPFECLEELPLIYLINERHPIDVENMRIIIGAYVTNLVNISRQLVPKENERDFLAGISLDEYLSDEWITLSCLMMSSNGRLNRLRLDPSLNKELRWADDIRDNNADCST
jgi:hypothetical protein